MSPAVIDVLPSIQIDTACIALFCEKWNVTTMELFGSVLRDDFRPDSDVDILVTFSPTAKTTLVDLLAMQDELKVLFGREVDLLTRKSVERSRNRYRRVPILESARVIYAK